jgi:PmbA protein
MTQQNDLLIQLSDVKQQVANVLEMAKQRGADSAEVAMSKQRGITASTRFTEVENIEFTQDGALGITVYCAGKKGSASTADLSEKALAQTVQAAIDIAKFTSVDPCSGLADKALLAMQPEDLDLYHPVAITPEKAIAYACECEQAALAADKRITNSDGASFSSFEGFRVYGNTHGQLVGYPSTRHNLNCVLIASDGEEMQRDYAYTVHRKLDSLATPQWVGEQAAKETLARLHSRKISTGRYPVMFRSDVANTLFGHFISAISGGNLYRKSSFLVDGLGKQVFPEFLTITEKPFIKGALASTPFDSEGVKPIERDIVENGVLSSYLLTSYSARKLGLTTTGNAGGIHNWQLTANGGDFKAMLQQLGTGLLVTELMGQGVNIVNGDYSRGAAGFWVENGEISFPVAEVTIAGNLVEMFKHLVAIGTDTELRGSIQTGSVLLQDMQVAGN